MQFQKNKLIPLLAAILLTLAHAAPSVQVTAPLPAVDADSVMLWAEQTYPTWFAGHPKTSTVANGAYRAYSVGGDTNYLGVTSADSKVWVMGATTKNQAISVGVLSDFAPVVYPGRGVPNSYVPGSLQARYFAEINDARIRGGFGQIEQDTHLDTAATNHANYFGYAFTSVAAGGAGLNPDIVCIRSLCAHEETMGLPFATGVYAEDRAKTAGWPYRVGTGASNGQVSEVISGGTLDSPTAVSGLLNTVYHRNGILNPLFTHVGVGVAPKVGDALAVNGFATVISPAYNVPRMMPDRWVGMYPGDGAQNFPTVMASEVPNPAPEFAVIGAPVSLHTLPTAGNKLVEMYSILKKELFTIDAFTLTAPDGSVIPGKVMNGETTGWIGVGNIFFVPSVALAKNTTYSVRFVGQENGVTNLVASWPPSNPLDITWSYKSTVVRTIDKKWTFTTGKD